MISRSGFTVHEAGTGGEGLFLYAKHRPAAVLLDFVLPDMAGDEVLRSIRQSDPDATVYIMTGYSGALTEDDILKMGARGYLLKPLTADHVRGFIDGVKAIRTPRE